MASAREGAQHAPQAGAFRRRTSRFLAALLVLCGGAARADKTEVTPSLSLSQTYTDNVSLAPEGSRLSDSITQLVPGISIASTGPRLRFSASYAPELLYYSKLDREDTVFHRGNAVGNLELAEKLLFIEAGAKVDQYDVSLQGPLTTSNVSVTSNRATTTSSYVTPYLLHDFGSAARAEVRHTYSVVRADEQTSLSDSEANRTLVRLTSGPAYRRFTWDTAFTRETIRYDETRQETTSDVYTAGARRLISPSVALLARAGYESYDSQVTGLVLDGSRWSAGFEWTPTPRTRLAATAGKRFDDDVYGLEFSHRTRLTTWSASYSEDITTARSEFFVPETASTAGTLDQLFAAQYPDPAERQKAVQEFIARSGLPPSLNAPVNFFSDLLFVQKRWLASVALQGARNTLIANAFWETREALPGGAALPTSGDFTASSSIRLAGTSLAWNLRVTPRNTWNLSAGYTRNEFLDTNRVDDYTYIRAGFTRRLQPRLSGSLFYRRQENESSQGVNVYVENAVVASVQATF
jgi:uncharacterized protein (PEP-CTERM system associated)